MTSRSAHSWFVLVLAAACQTTTPTTLLDCADDAQCPAGLCINDKCRPVSCTDTRVNGFETDVDCGGGQCPPCEATLLCLADSDCVSGLCALNRCALASCTDGLLNGKELGVDCGGSCAPCPTSSCPDGGCSVATCADGVRNGLETDVDCGGVGCAPCLETLTCLRNTDCASGSCADGHCGDPCIVPLRACGSACVNTQVDPQNCGTCGITCSGDSACIAGQCASACAGGTRQCGPACVDTQADPLHCGACSNPCSPGQACVLGMCVNTCPPGQTLCSSRCVSVDRDALHCGGCNQPCAAGAACVGGFCLAGCQTPLLSCNGGMLCVDPRHDPQNCGACGNACVSAPQADSFCINSSCVLGSCLPGFENCNGMAADGCEVPLFNDPLNCGACNRNCNMPQTCQAGHCCGGELPMGTYAATCVGCQVCDNALTCVCENAMQIQIPAMIPLEPPCPGGYVNCNGVLRCEACS